MPSASRNTRGDGQERHQRLADGDRPGTRTAAAVRRRERLVDVEVHDVEARGAGPELAQHRVHVGAVHVGQRARRVDGVEQLDDAVLEEAERRGVGQHHGRRARPERGPQRVEVDAAARRPRAR